MITVDIIQQGVVLSEFDGADWHRELVSTRDALIDWMRLNEFHDFDPDQYFPVKGES